MLDHRDAFIEALRAGPAMRRQVFDTLEQRYRQDFIAGRAGKNLYDALHAAVCDADVPGAEEEFKDRFLRLLKGRSPRKVQAAKQDRIAAADRGPSSRGWIASLCAVAVVVGILALGLVVLNREVTKPQTRAANVPHAQQPAAETPKPREPGPVIREVQDPPSEH
jgi:hypothetical protein